MTRRRRIPLLSVMVATIGIKKGSEGNVGHPPTAGDICQGIMQSSGAKWKELKAVLHSFRDKRVGPV